MTRHALTRYLSRRISLAIVVVCGVVVLTFFLSRVIPSDPAERWAGPHAGVAQVAQAQIALGLNRSVAYQIVHYFAGIFTGSWGTSIHTHRPVLSDLLKSVPASLELVIAALAIALVIGVSLGLLAARFR